MTPKVEIRKTNSVLLRIIPWYVVASPGYTWSYKVKLRWQLYRQSPAVIVDLKLPQHTSIANDSGQVPGVIPNPYH